MAPPKPSLLDRAIAAVSPVWGLQRAAARTRATVLASGYSRHGASYSKKSMVGWLTDQGGPDSDIVENLPKLRERSRDLFMGDALAAGVLRTIRTNEVGAGLRLNASIDSNLLGLTDEQAQAWEDDVERQFAMWADSKNCDAARRCTFGELQALARLSQLLSGDVFALLPFIDRPGDRFELKVQLVESDRVCDPQTRPEGFARADILGGVEVGPHGEPLAYWIENRHPGDAVTSGLRAASMPQWSRLPAFGADTGRPLVLHLMESERPGQRRGVPLLSPVMEQFKQLDRYVKAELIAAVVSGLFTAAVTSEHPQTPFAQAVPDTDRVDDTDSTSFELGPGAVVSLAPGEKLDSVNPTRPNAGFGPFVQSICQHIGAGVGMPYELLLKQFTSSYSASRGALLEAWKGFTVGRTWLAAGFCQPVYEEWLTEAVARGYIVAPGFFSDPLVRAAWCGAEWHGPTQGQLDPVKEVTAAKMRIDEGLSTRTRETRELTGGDYWNNHNLRAREEEARRRDGLAMEPQQPQQPTAPAEQPDGAE